MGSGCRVKQIIGFRVNGFCTRGWFSSGSCVCEGRISEARDFGASNVSCVSAPNWAPPRLSVRPFPFLSMDQPYIAANLSDFANVGLGLVRRGPPPPKQFWGFRGSCIVWAGVVVVVVVPVVPASFLASLSLNQISIFCPYRRPRPGKHRIIEDHPKQCRVPYKVSETSHNSAPSH